MEDSRKILDRHRRAAFTEAGDALILLPAVIGAYWGWSGLLLGVAGAVMLGIVVDAVRERRSAGR